MQPGISVIIPIYNVEQYLPQCLDSILAQTFTDFECILVDDSSPDDCSVICDKYAAKDNRFKVIHKKQNKGLPQARKTGLEYSSGRYIIHIDGDDYIETNMLEKMYVMAASQDYDMVYCDYYYHNNSDDTVHVRVPALSDSFILNIKQSILDFSAGGGTVWNKLIKKTIYDNITFPVYGYAEDSYITTQTIFFSKRIGYVNDYLYHQRFRQDSWVNNPGKGFERCRGAINNFKRVFRFLKKNHGKDLSMFDPELAKRIEWVKNRELIMIKCIIKKILRLMITPLVYNKLKAYYKMLFKKQKQG
jgi:glycosyltransferase involved in cell wall biosynthesis